MGLCIGLKDNDNVYIGVNSHMYSDIVSAFNKNNFKVWNMENVDNAIMGCQGGIRYANAVKAVDDFISDYDVFKDSVDFEFVLRNIAFRIKEVLSGECFVKRENGVFKSLNSSYMFGYKDKLYEISSDLSVCEIEDYSCLGSGTDEAIGSLESSVGEDPYKRIVL